MKKLLLICVLIICLCACNNTVNESTIKFEASDDYLRYVYNDDEFKPTKEKVIFISEVDGVLLIIDSKGNQKPKRITKDEEISLKLNQEETYRFGFSFKSEKDILITYDGLEYVGKCLDMGKYLKTMKSEIKYFGEDVIYVANPDKDYASFDFYFDDNINLQDFQIGDLVEISYFEEKRVDLTGKEFTNYFIETINKTEIDNMYKDEYKISDLIPFEVNMIKYSIPKPFEEDLLEYHEVEGQEAKTLLNKLDAIKIYSDANLRSIVGGYMHIIEFIGNNDEILTIRDNGGEVRVIYKDIEKLYGYHFTGDHDDVLYNILEKYFDIKLY